MKTSSFMILRQKTILFFILLATAGAGQSVIANTSVSPEESKTREQIMAVPVGEDVQKQLEKEWGIRVVALRSTMSGLMVDFRYKIIDARKASSLLDINTRAYLLVEKNKARLGVPSAKKVGSLRQTTHPKKVKEGVDYFILFGNPGARYIKPGDKATLVIGDLKVEHMTLL